MFKSLVSLVFLCSSLFAQQVVKEGETSNNLVNAIIGQLPESLVRPSLYLAQNHLAYRSKDRKSVLHYAILHNRATIAQKLIEYGCDVDAVDKYGYTPLHYACEKGLLDCARILLSAGCDRDLKTREGYSPLYFALIGKHNEIVDLLLSYRVSIDSICQHTEAGFTRDGIRSVAEKKLTPLDLALEKNDVELASLILAKGANRLRFDDNGYAAIHKAVEHCSLDMVELLLATNVDEQVRLRLRASDNLTPLHCVCRKKRDATKEIAAYLIKKGAAIDSVTNDKRTPLYYAIENSLESKLIELLVEPLITNTDYLCRQTESTKYSLLHAAVIANDSVNISTLFKLANETFCSLINQPDKNGQTPLHLACKLDKFEACEIILNNDMKNVTALATLDNFSYQPFHYACELSSDRIARLILTRDSSGMLSLEVKKNNIPLNSRASQKRPLHCAAQAGHDFIVEKLIKLGTDVNDKAGNQFDQKTALHFAIESKNKKLCTLLLAHKADPRIPCSQGLTPLHLASKFDLYEIADELIKKADDCVRYRDAQGYTPLHYAAQGGALKICELLLEKGADWSAENEDLETPLHLAADAGHTEICQKLIAVSSTIDTQDSLGATPLHRAAQKGHTSVCKLIKSYPSVLTRKGDTPLHCAAQSKQSSPDCIKELLSLQGYAWGAFNRDGFNALHCAARNNLTSHCEVLLENYHIHIDDQTKNEGKTALHIALEHNALDVVRFLLDHKASIRKVDLSGNTALHYAAKSQNKFLYDDLLKHDNSQADIPLDQITNKLGKKAFELFSAHKKQQADQEKRRVTFFEEGNDQFAKHLMGTQDIQSSHKTPLNIYITKVKDELLYAQQISDSSGSLPSTGIAKTISTGALREFLKNGSSGAKKSSIPKNPSRITIHEAAQKGLYPQLVRFLKNQLACDTYDSEGYTPLHYAVLNGYKDCCYALLKAGASPDSLSPEGMSALHFAASSGNEECCLPILKFNPDTQIKDANGLTAKEYAQKKGSEKIVRMITQYEQRLALKSTQSGELLLPQQEEDEEFSPMPLPPAVNELSCDFLSTITSGELDELLDILLKKGADGLDVNVAWDSGKSGLYCAVEGNRPDFAEFLIEAGASVDQESDQGDWPLAVAAQKGYLALCNRLIEAGANLSKINRNTHKTLLHYAAESSDLSCFEWLMNRLSPQLLKELDYHQESVLHYAAQRKCSKIAEMLVARGLDPFQKNSEGISSWDSAVLNNDDQLVEIFLPSVLRMAHSKDLLENAFFTSAKSGHVDMVKKLISHVNVNAQDVLGMTALHYACLKANRELIEYLISQGAVRFLRDLQGRLPIHCISKNTNESLLEYYSQTNDDLWLFRAPCAQGNTVLHWAVLENLSELVPTLTKKFDFKVTSKNYKGMTPLHLACLYGKKEVGESLLSLGNFEQNLLDIQGNSVLHYASYGRSHDLFKSVLNSYPALIFQPNHLGMLPLQVAVSAEKGTFVDSLIGKTSDDQELERILNAVDIQGRSALFIAAENKSHSLCKKFLSKKVDTSVPDSEGLLPLHVACSTNNLSLVKLLLAASPDDVKIKDAKGRTVLHFAAEFDDNSLDNDDRESSLIRLLVDSGALIAPVGDKGITPLHIAASCGNKGTCKKLLMAKHPTDMLTDDGETPLMLAVKKGHSNVVKMLCEQGASLKITDTKGNSLLHAASGKNFLEIATYLLQKEPSLKDSLNNANESVLYCSARAGNEDKIRFLIENGAKIDTESSDGLTPFFVAVLQGHKEVARLLLDAGAQIMSNHARLGSVLHVAANYCKKATNSEDSDIYCPEKAKELLEALLNAKKFSPELFSGRDQAGYTPLHYAIINGDLECTKILIDAGASVDEPDSTENGDYPLHCALRYGQKAVCRYLLERKDIDYERKNLFGATPLALAAGKGYLDMVFLLLQKGGSLDCTDKFALTPLHYAIDSGNKTLCQLLMRNGLSVNSVTRDGRTALYLACEKNEEELFNLLLKVRDIEVNVDENDALDRIPLHLATKKGNMRMVEALVNKGADLFKKDSLGKTVAAIAALKCDQSLCEYFRTIVKERWNELINSPFANGDTVLHTAVRQGNKAVCEFLLEQGASINAQNNDGMTALYIATIEQKTDICRFLLERGADVNKATSGGLTPLHQVFYNADDELFDLMVKRGEVNFAAITRDGLSVLNYALLGVKRELSDKEKQAARQKGDLDTKILKQTLIKRQYARCAYVMKGLKGIPKGLNLLHSAAQYQAVSLAKELLDRGVNLNTQTADGQTPLHYAAEHNRFEMVKFLLDQTRKVLKPNLRDANGDTALHRACKKNHKEVCLLLAKFDQQTENAVSEEARFIKLNEKNNSLNSPLEVALLESSLECAQILIEAGAELPDYINGESVMHYLARNGMAAVLRMVLKSTYNLEIDSLDSDGKTPLQRARENGNDECARVLIEHGAHEKTGSVLGQEEQNPENSAMTPINSLKNVPTLEDPARGHNDDNDDDDDQGPKDGKKKLSTLERKRAFQEKEIAQSMPLHYAVEHKISSELEKILNNEEVDINQRDSEGNTALHCALMAGENGLAYSLVCAGIDLTITNIKGKTAYQIAQERDNAEAQWFIQNAFESNAYPISDPYKAVSNDPDEDVDDKKPVLD